MLKETVEAWVRWLPTTSLAVFMHGRWEWPIFESIHFLGLSLLIGAIGLFDLRLLGLGRQIPIAYLHRLIPWGIAGYVINILSGICFFTAETDQYIYNPSFQLKILSMSVAGANVLVFYTTMFRKVRTLGPGENAPMPARIIGGVSLVCWLSVITFGRLLTFYRPPAFHWCPWC
jgi:hypothetical protein